MSIIDTLITDRTQADVDRVEGLVAKGYDAMSDAEKAEWDGEMNGAYNASDLNRVESVVAYLAAQLVAMPDELKKYAADLLVAWTDLFAQPYNVQDYADMETKTDWAMSDIPDNDSMARYLANVALLQTAFEADYPALPDSMGNLTFDGANAIEKVLALLGASINAERTYKQHLINNTASAWVYSGEIYANEV